VKARIGLLIVAILVALASCEIAARIVFPAPPDPTRQPQIVFRYDPDLKYIPVENQRGWVDDGFVTTNSLGFRGPEIATPKPSGRFRVVALGDSVTFGFGVNDTETFCAQAEQILRRSLNGRDVELVNLAVPGYDTLQEVGLIKRTAALLQPDLVLLGFYTNDVPDALAEKESSGGGTTIAAANPVKGQVLHMNPTPTSWLEAQLRRSRAIYTGGHALKALVRRGEGKAGSSLELDLLENHRSADLERAWNHHSATARTGLGAIRRLPISAAPSSHGGQAGILRRRSVAGHVGQSNAKGSALHSVRSQPSVCGRAPNYRRDHRHFSEPARRSRRSTSTTREQRTIKPWLRVLRIRNVRLAFRSAAFCC